MNPAPPLPTRPRDAAAMPFRPPVGRQPLALQIDTANVQHNKLEPEDDMDTRIISNLARWQVELDVELLLFQCKTILDYAGTSDKKYSVLARLAKQAYDLAAGLQDIDLTARCCFYLGECEMAGVRENEKHLVRTRELYMRCVLCNEPDAVEPHLARKRLEELNKLFPSSALSEDSNIAPWSTATSAVWLSAGVESPRLKTGLAERLLQRAIARGVRRGFDRMPSFDSAVSDTSSADESRNALGTASDTASLVVSCPPMAQMMLGAYAAGYNTKSPVVAGSRPQSRSKTVAFVDGLAEHRGSTGKDISRRRKLDRSITTPSRVDLT